MYEDKAEGNAVAGEVSGAGAGACGVVVASQPNLEALDVAPLGLQFWMMLVVTGVAAGLAGGLLMKLLRGVEHLTFAYTAGGFLDAVRQVSARRRLLAEVCAGVFAAGMAVWVASMEGGIGLDWALWKRSGRIPVVKGMISAVGSIVTVGMGAAIGRENALKQAGGVIGNVAATWRNLPDDQRRLLVACGGGAGMAAAYNVPMGGAVFALEVLLGSFSLRSVVPAFATSMLAVWTSWLMLPDEATYRIAATVATPGLIVWAALAGPVCGVIGAGFIRLLGWAKGTKPKGWQVAGLPVLSLAVLGVVAMRYPELLGNGKDVVQQALANQGATGLLLVLLVLRPLATAVIVRSGVPGGLFTPTMSLGAVAGSLLGRLWAAVAPALGKHAEGQMPSCALIGSAAMLAATTQGPVSSVVFVLELTRTADSLMVPLLVGVVTATLVTRRFEKRSIYSIETAHEDEPEGMAQAAA